MAHVYDMQTITARTRATLRRKADSRAGYRLEDSHWGYCVVPLGPPPVLLVLTQIAALLSGAVFLAAAVATAVLADPSDLAFRVPVIFVAFALGVGLMWFASRGSQIHIEVDTKTAEVREVIRNRTGACTVMARYGFDSIGSVFLVRPKGHLPTLMLRFKASARQLPVAIGTEADLTKLRDRLGRDLILRSRHDV